MTLPPHSSPDSDDSKAGDALDAEAGRIFDDYLAGLEAGRPADPEGLLAAHPQLADRLQACLAVMQIAHDMADRSGSAAVPDRSTPKSDASTTLPAGSALTSLGLEADAVPHVHLRDVPDEREPLVRPRFDLTPAPREREGAFGRYQLQGEIARGGMGAVLKGRNVNLGRDLAIKVLPRVAPAQPRGRAPVHRRGADRRPVAAPGGGAGLRAGRLPRPAPLFRDEAGQGPDAGCPAGRARPGPACAAPPPNAPPRRGEGDRAGGGFPDPALSQTEGLPLGGHAQRESPSASRVFPTPPATRCGAGLPDRIPQAEPKVLA